MNKFMNKTFKDYNSYRIYMDNITFGYPVHKHKDEIDNYIKELSSRYPQNRFTYEIYNKE